MTENFDKRIESWQENNESKEWISETVCEMIESWELWTDTANFLHENCDRNDLAVKNVLDDVSDLKKRVISQDSSLS